MVKVVQGPAAKQFVARVGARRHQLGWSSRASFRPPLDERTDVSVIESMQIWSPIAGRMIPLSQVVSGTEIRWEDPIVVRRNRFPTITVHADPRSGLPSELFNEVRAGIDNIELPPGYALDWGGQYEDSGDAQRALAEPLPYFLAAMVFIVVCLFNSFRITALIWLIMPLAIIGVTVGLLLTGQPFGFMALLVVGFAQKYDKDVGVGTVVSPMLPYVVIMFVLWTLLFAVWQATGLPWGL